MTDIVTTFLTLTVLQLHMINLSSLLFPCLMLFFIWSSWIFNHEFQNTIHGCFFPGRIWIYYYHDMIMWLWNKHLMRFFFNKNNYTVCTEIVHLKIKVVFIYSRSRCQNCMTFCLLWDIKTGSLDLKSLSKSA